MILLYTGVDIVETERIRRVLNRHPGFIKRYFTDREGDYFFEKNMRIEHITAGFAAKEAVSKCIGGLSDIRLKDIEIIRGGRPEVRLWGNAERKAQSLGIRNISLSLSHSDDYAVAFAVAEGGE